MFHIAFVVFREFLEISILIGIFSSVARNVKDYKTMLVAGIFLGASGSALLAFFTERISNSLDGVGSEIFDSIIILVTVSVLSITIVWIETYSRKIKKSLNNISETIESDFSSKIIFILLIASTILREGSELVLLLHSIATVERSESTTYLNGFALGAVSGVLFGIGVYLGMFRLAGRYVLSASSIFMTFIAAGLSAEAARILSSIGIINILTDRVWDTSFIASDDSIAGKFLKVMFGYSARPIQIELLFYLMTILIIFTLSKVFTSKKTQ